MIVYCSITMRFGSSLGGLKLRCYDILVGISYLQFKKQEVKIQITFMGSFGCLLIRSTILLEG